MSTSGLFVLIALLLGAILFIVWPLIGTPAAANETPADVPSGLAKLRAEHESILTAIRDLDFDQQTGKLTDADYQAQRVALMARGVETLRLIDSLTEDQIETAVAAKRAERPALNKRIEKQIEMSVAARRKRAKVK